MPQERWDEKEWRQAIADLKVLCPIGGGANNVSIRRVSMPDDTYGDCDKRKGRFYIRIDKNARFHEALLLLSHEWAHAMTWPLYKHRDEHHFAYFGIAWAEAYRAIFYMNR